MKYASILALAACGTSRGVPAAPPPTNAVTPAAAVTPWCRAEADHLVASGPNDPAAPIAIVWSRSPWSGFDFPEVAVWPNGDVFIAGTLGHVRADIATRLARELARQLEGVPPYVSISDGFDLPKTELAVRDGARWRWVSVYGFAVPGVQSYASVHAVGDVDSDAPESFVRAVRRLLGINAVDRKPYVPDSIVLQIGGVDGDTKWVGTPIPWPDELPKPPVRRAMSDEGFGEVFDFEVAGVHDALVAELVQKMRGSRPLAVHGHNWVIYPHPKYRGQPAIERLRDCVDQIRVSDRRAEE